MSSTSEPVLLFWFPLQIMGYSYPRNCVCARSHTWEPIWSGEGKNGRIWTIGKMARITKTGNTVRRRHRLVGWEHTEGSRGEEGGNWCRRRCIRSGRGTRRCDEASCWSVSRHRDDIVIVQRGAALWPRLWHCTAPHRTPRAIVDSEIGADAGWLLQRSTFVISRSHTARQKFTIVIF